MSVSGPSQFVDVANVSFLPITYSTQSSTAAAINIYSVSKISIRQNVSVLKGMENSKKCPVSAHPTTESITVSIDTVDIAAVKALQAYKGLVGTLTFTWKASSQQLTTSPLADATVTIHNMVIEGLDPDAAGHGFGSGAISGSLLETSDSSDPVVYS